MGTLWEQFCTFMPNKKCKMKVSAFIRKASKKNDTDSQVAIYFRIRDNHKDLKVVTKLKINPNHWNPEKQGYKDRVALVSNEVKNKLKEDIQNITSLINEGYNEHSDAKWLNVVIDKYHNPSKYKTKETLEEDKDKSIIALFDDFLLKHDISDVRKKNFKVIKRSLQRFEVFYNELKMHGKELHFTIDSVDVNMLYEIWDYFENEYLYFEQYPFLFAEFAEKRTPKERGKNTLIDYFNKLRTFFLWCYRMKKTDKRPFDSFKIEEAIYGSPIYITLNERDQLFNFDFSSNKELETIRDIFVFQSLVGCRVSDLFNFTKDSIVHGAIEYIPRKTKEGNPITVRVPLNAKAQEILVKYNDLMLNSLLPFPSSHQLYNEKIKEIFRFAGINRIVTALDPKTRKEYKTPICEIASSQMARRTFVGNLYKKVKDPNLIGTLSGHKQGSKAFSRYREIDDEIKKEIVNLIN